MVGPVLNLELMLGSRRGRHYVFRWIYGGWLVLLSVVCLFAYWISANVAVLHLFTEFLILQQFALILVVTPTFTAGAITDEKGRGTLQDLLAAGLTSWEIVAGKLLGRLTQVAILLMCGLPVLCFLGVFGGLDPLLLLAVVLVSALTLFALAAGSLLASVWTRETRTAVLAVYLVAGLSFVVTVALGVWEPFFPLYVIEPAWGEENPSEFAHRFLIAGLAWAGVGAGCLALAVCRMRVAYMRQLEARKPVRRGRWWASRAPLGDDPVRWRERQVEGLAPLPVLRAVPRGLGLIAIFGLTALAAIAGLLMNLPIGVTPRDVGIMVAHRDFQALGETLRDLNDPSEVFLTLNLIALVAATFVVGIRCSGAVSRERERRTWEALLLTPLSTRGILRGKLWAVLGATWPYLGAYALAAVPLAVLGGFWSLLLTLILGGVTLLGTFFVGCAGLWCSVVAKSSWRSLAGTMAFTYVGGAVVGGFLSCPIMIVAAIVWGLLTMTLKAIDRAAGTQWAGSIGGGATFFYCFILTTGLVLALLAFGLAWYFLLDAEKRIADTERTRHWKDAFRFPRRRAAWPARPYR